MRSLKLLATWAASALVMQLEVLFLLERDGAAVALSAKRVIEEIRMMSMLSTSKEVSNSKIREYSTAAQDKGDLGEIVTLGNQNPCENRE